MELDWLQYDREHVWHPYTRAIEPPVPYLVDKALGCKIRLADGRVLIDGMSSWWAVIHGYNRAEINKAIKDQMEDFAHVMFGGLTHRPAIKLAKTLIDITPSGLEHVFFSDSGSVAIEVAIKMALQYQAARGQKKRKKLLTLRGGYHGDTLGAMSVCDPETGMHSLFSNYLPQQIFVKKPSIAFDEHWESIDMDEFTQTIERHQSEVAAVILEPVVQGAGGMWFYHPNYLSSAKELCGKYNILLIADEIATGFGRTGKLFASEHARVTPDILCLGKALTGGYMTLAATLTNYEIAKTISSNEPKAFLHGPTFMANPLACACALQSIEILKESDWQNKINKIEGNLRGALLDLKDHPVVEDVRVLGAIGVVQLKNHVNIDLVVPEFIKNGVWIRPFKDLIYIMPPYVISEEELYHLTYAINTIIKNNRLF